MLERLDAQETAPGGRNERDEGGTHLEGGTLLLKAGLERGALLPLHCAPSRPLVVIGGRRRRRQRHDSLQMPDLSSNVSQVAHQGLDDALGLGPILLP